MNYEEKYRELAAAVKRWLAIDDFMAEHGCGKIICFEGREVVVDELWDEAKNSLQTLLCEETK